MSDEEIPDFHYVSDVLGQDREVAERWDILNNVLGQADALEPTDRETLARALLKEPPQAQQHLSRDAATIYDGVASRLRDADDVCTSDQAAELRSRVETRVRDWLT